MLELEQTQKKITTKIAAGENCRLTNWQKKKNHRININKKLIANWKLNIEYAVYNIIKIVIVIVIVYVIVVVAVECFLPISHHLVLLFSIVYKDIFINCLINDHNS